MVSHEYLPLKRIYMALGGCNNFSSLTGPRFVLGMLELCSTPAYLLITQMWYKVEEQPIRIGYWSTFLGLANSLKAFSHMELDIFTAVFNLGDISSLSLAHSPLHGVLIVFFFLAENLLLREFYSYHSFLLADIWPAVGFPQTRKS